MTTTAITTTESSEAAESSEATESYEEIIGRSGIDDVDEILAVVGPVATELVHEAEQGGVTRFTWDYRKDRTALEKLYSKAKRGQWNVETDLDWSIDVDRDKVSRHLLETMPQVRAFQEAAAGDRTCPMHGWSDDQFAELAWEYQTYGLSQFLHGEQGALVCTAKITEQVPWIEAKYYAATQVMDEARHVEVFDRYLTEKVRDSYVCNGHLLLLLDDIIRDDRWDMTYMGMQIMVEGLALASFGYLAAATEEPLLKKLLRYVMSDEARHVAFGVLSLKEAYAEMSAQELQERQEFAFEAGLRMRDRLFYQDMWERLGLSAREMLTWMRANPVENQIWQAALFSKIVPNLKKLGLLDAGDGWLRDRYTEMGIIAFEDFEDTATEFSRFDISSELAG